MYPWLWRHLPGPLVARLGQLVLLLVGVLALLFLVVFPKVEAALPYSDVTVPTAPPSSGAPTPSPGVR